MKSRIFASAKDFLRSCISERKLIFQTHWFELKKESGEIKKYLVEVKPYAQTQKPVRKSTRRQSVMKYRRELFTYMKNLSKWQSAINFCINKDWKFIFLTERNGEKGKWKLWDWEDIGLPIEVR